MARVTIKDGRKLPFCWQEKAMIRRIHNFYEDHPETTPAKSVILATYLGMTMIASDFQSDSFTASLARLADRGGCDLRTVQRALQVLSQIPAIRVFSSKGTGLPNRYELIGTMDSQSIPIDSESIGYGLTVQGGRTHSPRGMDSQSNPSLEESYIEESSLEGGGENGARPPSKKEGKKSDSNQIKIFREITRGFPDQALYDQVIKTIGSAKKEDLLPYYQAWISRGYNPKSLTWLFEWFVNRSIPSQKKDVSRSAGGSAAERRLFLKSCEGLTQEETRARFIEKFGHEP